jgi:molecular chaperone GrpE
MQEQKNKTNPDVEQKQQQPPASEQTAQSPKAAGRGEEIDGQPAAACPEQAQPQDAKPPAEAERLADDLAALTDKHLRLAAEYDNFRKRSQRERETIYPDATAAAASVFLAVADNFERALAAPCADADYKKGTELTYKSLMEAFARLGVEAFGAPGDPFDPALHDAVMHVQDDSEKAAAISEVFLKGYRIGPRVLRCAMVKVVN